MTKKLPTWEEHVSLIQTIPDLSEIQKSSIASGFLAIRETLGDDWLALAHERGCPILQLLRNHTAWAQQSIAAFGRQLQRSKNASGFHEVTRQLFDHGKYQSAATQLRLASRYLTAGFGILFEPEVNAARADLLIYANPEHFVELKSLQPSVEDHEAHNTFAKLHSLLPLGTTCKAKISKPLSTPQFRHLASRITDAVARIDAGEREVFLARDGAYEMVLTKGDSPSRSSLDLDGLRLGADDLRRLRSLVRTTPKHQLPLNAPSILIVNVDPFHFTSPEDAKAILEAVDETLFEHAHVIALVITSSWVGGGTPSFEDHERYQLFQRVDFDFCVEAGIVVKNAYGQFPFRPDLIRPILQAVD